MWPHYLSNLLQKLIWFYNTLVQQYEYDKFHLSIHHIFFFYIFILFYSLLDDTSAIMTSH